MSGQTSEQALREAIAIAGSQRKLAKQLGIVPNCITQYLKRGRVPAERCVQIERITGIGRERLRPDLYESGCDAA